MKPVQSLIQKAHDNGLLRYGPHKIVWDENQQHFEFELRRTLMSGVEFCYDLYTDKILWAIQSVDGVELEPADFLQELKTAVGMGDEEFPDKHSHEPQVVPGEPFSFSLHAQDSEGRHYYLNHKVTNEGVIIDVYDRYGREVLGTRARTYEELVDEILDDERALDVEGVLELVDEWNAEEQPFQNYAQTRAIVDEEPEVTEHSAQAQYAQAKLDRGLNRYIVTEMTSIDAYSEEDAIERVVSGDKSGEPEVVSQEAEIQLTRWRVGHESYFWAENREHAIEQYLDMMRNDNGFPNVVEVVSYK